MMRSRHPLVCPETGRPPDIDESLVATSKPVPMVLEAECRLVANGLALPADFRGWVAVHDGVRLQFRSM
jgi:hypothetical protein